MNSAAIAIFGYDDINLLYKFNGLPYLISKSRISSSNSSLDIKNDLSKPQPFYFELERNVGSDWKGNKSQE